MKIIYLHYTLLCLFCALFIQIEATAQVPDTDIFLFNVENKQTTKWTLSKPLNITNRKGYDNQPHFLPNNEGILYTAIRTDEQADIYCYVMKDKSRKRLTYTDKTSEYSPIALNEEYMSVVRVEEDGKTQRLWKFPLNLRKAKDISNDFPDIKGVGYHAWVEPDSLAAVFIIGEPHTLHLMRKGDTTSHLIAGHIGRCLQKIPTEHAISFVQKVSHDKWYIKRLDLETWDITTITQSLSGSEDYIHTSDGGILMGKKGKLYLYHPSHIEKPVIKKEVKPVESPPDLQRLIEDSQKEKNKQEKEEKKDKEEVEKQEVEKKKSKNKKSKNKKSKNKKSKNKKSKNKKSKNKKSKNNELHKIPDETNRQLPNKTQHKSQKNIMTFGGKSKTSGWKEIADLSQTAAKNFYRLALSPDGKYLAVVAQVGE